MKTNCKKAVENIKNFILENFDPVGAGYEEYYYFESIPDSEKWEECKKIIKKVVYNEKIKNDLRILHKNYINYKLYFTEWCQGLPSILNTDYYVEPIAKKIIMEILEESEEEAEKYTEEEAETLLTYLLYREIYK